MRTRDLSASVAVGMAVGAITFAALVPRMPAGGVRVLVGPPVFKTGVSSDPAQAGSIPVRLRYQPVYLPRSPSRSTHTCLLAQTLAQFHSIELLREGQHGDPEAQRLLAGQGVRRSR